MKMRLLSLVALMIFSSHALAASYDATNCEIFVDKIQVMGGSHGLRTLVLFVKTINSRLDSSVVEVGFYNHETTHGTGGGTSSGWGNWTSTPLSSFQGASDYYMMSLYVSSDFSSNQFEGALYVKTANGTTYWAKRAGGNNFLFDNKTTDLLETFLPLFTPPSYSPDPLSAVGTQVSSLKDFNGGVCY